MVFSELEINFVVSTPSLQHVIHEGFNAFACCLLCWEATAPELSVRHGAGHQVTYNGVDLGGSGPAAELRLGKPTLTHSPGRPFVGEQELGRPRGVGRVC